MEIRYAKSAAKALERLDKGTKARIRAGIEGLTQKPPQGDIKPCGAIQTGGSGFVLANIVLFIGMD